MKFELTENQPGSTTTSGTADGTWGVYPEAVFAVLNEVQTMASGFNDLLMEAETSMASLAEACKAPPITTELTTFSIMMQKRTIRSAAGRTMVAVDAVADATLALVQGDEQMSDTAREAAAMAAQEHVDDAPGAADRPQYVRHGSPQAF